MYLIGCEECEVGISANPRLERLAQLHVDWIPAVGVLDIEPEMKEEIEPVPVVEIGILKDDRVRLVQVAELIERRFNR
jgi:hypothetical protein